MDWSETSQIAVLFTREHGKLSATARGAKRTQPSTLARFSGGLEILTGANAVWMSKRGAELANLTEWDLTQPNWHIRQQLRGFRFAMYAVDLLHHLLAEHDPHPELFDYTVEFLGNLQDRESHYLHMLFYQWLLCRTLGYQPALLHDAGDGADLNTPEDGTYLFSPDAGGLVNSAIGKSWRTRVSTVEVLRQCAVIVENPRQGDYGLKAAPEEMERANKLLCAYLREIIGEHLPTMSVLIDEPVV